MNGSRDFGEDVNDNDTELAPIEYQSLRISRPRISKKQLRVLLIHRYGSDSDFSSIKATYASISRSTGVHSMTIRGVIMRYHELGNRYDPAPWSAWTRKRTLSSEIEDYLALFTTL